MLSLRRTIDFHFVNRFTQILCFILSIFCDSLALQGWSLINPIQSLVFYFEFDFQEKAQFIFQNIPLLNKGVISPRIILALKYLRNDSSFSNFIRSTFSQSALITD